MEIRRSLASITCTWSVAVAAVAFLGCSSAATVEDGTGGIAGRGGGRGTGVGGESGSGGSGSGGTTATSSGSGGSAASGAGTGGNGSGGTMAITSFGKDGGPDINPHKDAAPDLVTTDGKTSAQDGRGQSGAGGTGVGSQGTGGITVAGGTTGGTGAGGTGAPITVAKFVGNITTNNQVDTGGLVYANYWDQISPENAGKWGSVQSSGGGSFNWTTLDAIYDYTEKHKIIFKEHNFIWGSQQPGGSITSANVQAWMQAFCKRYPNTKLIDVVNEPPPHTTPSYADAIGGGTNGDWKWITNAFT